MVTAARTLLDGSPERVWSAFDPINGYAQPLAGHRPGRLPGSLVHPIALRKPGGSDSASDIRRPTDVSPGRGAHGWGMKVNGIEKSTPMDRPVWLEQPDAHDQWNFMARRETPTQRLDRNYAEILQELRIAQTGVQLLLAFLLMLLGAGIGWHPMSHHVYRL